MKYNEANGQPNRIEKGTKITGEIQSESDFRIDGILEGSISTSGKVVIGKEGKINGKVICKNADFEGVFSGNLEVKETLTLKSSSKTEGDVIISKLIVDAGAFFNAKCSMKLTSDVKSISDNREKIA
ncbi:MAG: polymer-forming cytoskeletal protein [Flavobacteriaceae bacterium]|jgi:cytoskeletal protein CcmA (bactofilin family)|nr:MAG: polymer-forming cytoskeletal protein [Flavobacteriaceae bacterium TMED220]|tara:strand:- start:410 stop:790 length:381 start_codon:yes stop_codon:yes gene_type:complete